MKRLLLILILTLNFQTLTNADDIRDFQIEGMSIGDSLLDYFTEDEITNSIKKNSYKDNSFLRLTIKIKNNSEYDLIEFHIKKKDSKKIIHMIAGIKFYINDIRNCLIKKKTIEDEFRSLFKKSKFEDKGKLVHPQDKTGKSYVDTLNIFLKSGGAVSLQCYNWTKKMKFNDTLKVKLADEDYIYWMRNKAWK